MKKELKINGVRRSIETYYECENVLYFITTELGINYDDMTLIFRKMNRAFNTFSVHSRYNMQIGVPITHNVYGTTLREDKGCDGVIKITCIIPLQMKNYRLAILQEQKKILNILRSKIECRKASVSAKSGTSK